MPNFPTTFKALTGNDPFPWQSALYERFCRDGVDNIPKACNLPTGLGKTSVIAIWLIALANKKNVPRRLVYVVNRRTVVDQTTEEVEKYFAKKVPGIAEFAISTLRGQFADNREWSADPSRPAVICGTVDMIGSRLLFSGYGVGFKGKPLHAGFLGQDALLIHDEAHLEPAFQKLIEAIEEEQDRCKEFGKFRVMELTATSRGDDASFPNEAEKRANEADSTVQQRIGAPKLLELIANADPKKLAEELAKKALTHEASGKAILIFARTVDDVLKIRDLLPKGRVITLTGTMRGLERDRLVEHEIFKRFLPNPLADGETVYLVCTSAGEVGINISAYHLACDLSTYESMAQRFGRVNRFGLYGDTRVQVIHPTSFGKEGKVDEYDVRRQKTLKLLGDLKGDASPKALGDLPSDNRIAAFAPPPTILPVTDILFDAWALTTIKGKLPGRPPVEPYLHGLSEYDPPQTTVAWREEVERLTEAVLKRNKLDFDEVLAAYPLKPHEELSGPTHGKNKVFEQLEAIAKRDAKIELKKQHSAWLVDADGSVELYTLQKLVERDSSNKPVVAIGGRTVILPPAAGGLTLEGLLKGDEPFSKEIKYDVSDLWFSDKARTIKRRERSEDDEPSDPEMREVLHIDIPTSEANDDAETEPWYWFVRPQSADDDGSKYAKRIITWQHHTDDVTNGLVRIAAALFPDNEALRTALKVAAKLHDLGKKRIVWQKSIGNPIPNNWHAKSGWDPIRKRKWKSMELTTYRHEFGSLVDLETDVDFLNLPSEDMKDLVLHLIAAHHGYSRPHFPEPFDPEPPAGVSADDMAMSVPRRFARLQRKYGRWGLAYLESLLRAADWAASAKPSEFVKEEKK